MTVSDRLEEIKHRNMTPTDDILWLIAEVERLRAVLRDEMQQTASLEMRDLSEFRKLAAEVERLTAESFWRRLIG